MLRNEVACSAGAAPFSRLGGEIQIQLALTKAANRKDDECIALLKTVEDTHPIKAVNKQAGDLKFIMEAPKLKVEDDEKLTLPSLSHIREKKCEQAPLKLDCSTTNIIDAQGWQLAIKLP